MNDGDLGSFARVPAYFKRHFPSLPINKISQTNYCFFRSKDERQISADDLKRCRPLFAELLSVMEPSLVLSFSSRLRDYLLRSDQVRNSETVSVQQQVGKRTVTCTAVAGMLEGGTPVAFLPHPNYPMQRSVRKKLWDFCANQVRVTSRGDR